LGCYFNLSERSWVGVGSESCYDFIFILPFPDLAFLDVHYPSWSLAFSNIFFDYIGVSFTVSHLFTYRYPCHAHTYT
jgi:hypothetical protein